MNFGDGGSNARAADELLEVETDDVAFRDISLQKGGNPVRVTEPWEVFPPVHASLVSVASRAGLLAVAGPSQLVVAHTESLRTQAIPARLHKGEERVVRENGQVVEGKACAVTDDEPSPIPAKAHLVIGVPRLSHVAFSADESCLVIVAEQGGGLAVYPTTALVSGNRDPAFSISTNGVSVRHLLPNPNPDAPASALFGIVLTNGQLLLADLQARSLRRGPTSEVFHQNVFSASWSKLGKQIIAGMGDGTCAQIDQQGAVKDHIPVAPQLAELVQADYQGIQNMPITTIHWLETNKFLIIYSPIYGKQHGEGVASINDSIYFFAERKKNEGVTFHKLAQDPSPPFGLERFPANHFLSRLGRWEPNLGDLVIASSTASTDVGVIADGQFFTGIDAVSREKRCESTNGRYSGLRIRDDGHRAALPTSLVKDGDDTSPIGTALDFGSRILLARPIPNESDTLEQSPHPLPCFCLVNTDGLLYMWWIVYLDGIRQKKPHSKILHTDGKWTTYNDLATKYNRPLDDNANPIAPEIVEPPPTGLGDQTPAATTQSSAEPAFGGTSMLGGNKPSVWGAPPATPGGAAFGKPSFGQTPLLGATPAATPGGAAFGKPSFGFGKPSLAQPSTSSGFMQSAQTSGNAFGQIAALGGNKAAWQTSLPSPFASAGTKPSPFASPGQTSSSPFANLGDKTGPSPLGGAEQTSSWSFASADAKAGQDQPAAWAKTPSTGFSFGKPSVLNGASTGSTVTLGSNGTFGAPSAPSGSPFNSKPMLSTEPTTGDANAPQSGGLPSLSDGFKLGSTFKGDGTAHGDLPKPQHPGGDFFGSLGLSLSDAENKKPEAQNDVPAATHTQTASGIRGTSKELSNMPVPSGLFGKKEEQTLSDAPLPPDPAKFDYKKKQAEMAPPLPPDPAKFDYKKKQAEMTPPPGAGKSATPSIFDKPKNDGSPAEPAPAPLPPDLANPSYTMNLAEMAPPGIDEQTTPPRKEKDIPIAGSPPQDITHSQTFSSNASEEAGPPEDSGSEIWSEEGDEERLHAEGEEDDEEQDDQGEEDDEEQDDEGEENDDDEEEEGGKEDVEEKPYQPDNPSALNKFLARIGPKSPATTPKSRKATKAQTKSTTPKAKSYTPDGLPPGPILQPSGQPRTGQSPRSPSPQRQPAQQRSVTSPVPRLGPMQFPPQIKTTSVPPAKPVERPKKAAKPSKPRVTTAGELADEQDARVKELLAQPVEPSKELPVFYTHQDYAGAVETPGLGGQIEKVFRDVNSMIDVVGLNARSLMTFITGHERLKNSGQRSREDLDDGDAWTLGEMDELARIMDELGQQLEAGKVEHVRNKLELLAKEQCEALKLKSRTSEMRKQVLSYTDPARKAEHDAAPLDAETAAQQSELRRKLRDVYQLLSDVEQSMSLLRAELASASAKSSKAPVPTVESVERTILRMTAMVEKASGDVDLLESQIRRLPNGMKSLRNGGGLGDDYEDDLVGRLGASQLLSDSPRRRSPQKYGRMAADGSALGMSGMFGSQFSTPPSAPLRQSLGMSRTSFAPRMSTASLRGSVRAKKTMNDVTEEEVDGYCARLARRREVLGALKRAVTQQGVRVVKVEQ